MESDYINKKELKEETPTPIPNDDIFISEQMKNSLCKIKCSNGGYGIGFFCKIPISDKLNFLPVLITNNHILNKNDISNGKTINLLINDENLSLDILIDNSRKTYTNEIPYDITFIEIKNSDNLNIDSFLEIDIKNDTPSDIYKQNSIYLLYYNNDLKVEYSVGEIKSIGEDNYSINYLCETHKGSSGGPIMNLNNYKVIGIDRENKEENNYSVGTYIRAPTIDFIEKIKIINTNNGNYNEQNSDINQDKDNGNKKSFYNIIEIKDNSYEDDFSYKVIVIGDSFVGKENITQSLFNKNYINSNCESKIGFDIFNYRAKINDKIIRLQFWDTCNLHDFNCFSKSLFYGTSLAIIVYSINKRDSFEHLPHWLNLFKNNTNPDSLTFIVGNKTDLEDGRKVSKEEGEKLKEEFNVNFFIEFDCKNHLFVKELLENAIIQLYEQEKIIEEDKVMFRESFDRDRTNCFHLRTPSKIKTLKKKKFC